MIQHAPTLKKRAIKRSFTANLRKNSSVVPASGGRHSEGADRSLAVNFEKKARRRERWAVVVSLSVTVPIRPSRDESSIIFRRFRAELGGFFGN